MKNLICVLPLALMFGCGDKDEDTAADSAAPAEDTAAAVDTAAE